MRGKFNQRLVKIVILQRVFVSSLTNYWIFKSVNGMWHGLMPGAIGQYSWLKVAET
jgi:hypothetical protein